MEQCLLVEYLNSLNTIIVETFKCTQRVKITSFGVCNGYVVFGASSGGIYIFKRIPCQFLKLIPSKEGAAVLIDISKNEKNLSVATSRGVILILENVIENNALSLLYNEHEGSIVTCMKWCGNNVYCGDSTGKLSVFTLTSILSKSIFQTPSAVLMQLDSSIVQIDSYSNYLLISTRTRTYLCNTEKEQYKQIGKKLRDGPFGACFLNTNNAEAPVLSEKNSIGMPGIFTTLMENEQFSNNLTNDNVKIYCARPGVRLWEANFEATVLVTHQFRNSLALKPGSIIVIDDKIDARLNIIYPSEGTVAENFNFGNIYPVYQRFIVTYDKNGIYFFDSLSSCLYSWSNAFHIKDVKVVNNYIYLWKKDLKVSVIAIQSLEEIIVNTLLKKQYYLCSELCLKYSDEVLRLIEKSKRIYLISTLKNRLPEIGANGMLDKLSHILDMIEDCKNKEPILKIHNHIAVIDNGYNTQLFNETYNNVKKTDTHPNEPTYNGNKEVMALYKQYILNKSHNNVELTEASNVLESLDLNNMLKLFEEFIDYVTEKDNEDATKWCQEQMLKQTNKKIKSINSLEPKTLEYVRDAFFTINKVENFNCKCLFPLPNAHTERPTYYDVGCRLIEMIENRYEYLNNIPYMYKYQLGKMNDLDPNNLALLVQFSDMELYKQFCINFTYNTCDEILKYFIKLMKGCCLNCGGSISIEGLITWTELGLIVVESIGAKDACMILKRYSGDIPSGELDCKFYQGCILATAYKEPRLALNFMDTVINADNEEKFEDLMQRYLQKKCLAQENGTASAKRNACKEDHCVFCGLPLSESILIEVKKAVCGHNFHKLCFSHNNGMCNICQLSYSTEK